MNRKRVITVRLFAGLYVLGLLFLYWIHPARPNLPEAAFPVYAGHFSNYIPFLSTIEQFRRLAEHTINTDIVLRNTLGHIAVFFPLGILMKLAVKSDWKAHLFGVVVFSVLLEIVQLLFRIGSFDIDSVLFNAIGYLLGYGAMTLLLRLGSKQHSPDNNPD